LGRLAISKNNKFEREILSVSIIKNRKSFIVNLINGILRQQKRQRLYAKEIFQLRPTEFATLVTPIRSAPMDKPLQGQVLIDIFISGALNDDSQEVSAN
jgi:hypothetical protein